MSVFRRRKSADADEVDGDAVDQVEGDQFEADTSEDAADTPPPIGRPEGPWDVDDAPDDEIQRIDLGAMRVPVPADTEVRVDVGPDGQVIAATLVQGDSALQVNVFAAPRTIGIWAEVREEIATALREGGGKAEEAEGTYGPELEATVPSGDTFAPARFLGVDGPRWFVRALVTGPAATDRAAGAELEAALRNLIVVRGGTAMAVRDPLPLALPKEVAEQAAAAQAGEASTSEGESDADTDTDTDTRSGGGEPPGGLSMPERGPEITETR